MGYKHIVVPENRGQIRVREGKLRVPEPQILTGGAVPRDAEFFATLTGYQ